MASFVKKVVSIELNRYAVYDAKQNAELNNIKNVDFYQGDDYFIQSQLVHDMTDNFEITVGLDIIGGPSDTFFGRFRDNDRVFVKLKYTF